MGTGGLVDGPSMEHFDPRAGVTNSNGSQYDTDGRRRSGRLEQEAVRCQLGPVVNLSVGGMRVVCRKVPRGEMDIILYGPDEPTKVRARVAWWKRTGLFKYEAGFQFLDVDETMARKLTSLASSGRRRRTM